MKRSREFRNPKVPIPEDLDQLLRGDNPHTLAAALIGVALGSDDLGYAFRIVTLPDIMAHSEYPERQPRS